MFGKLFKRRDEDVAAASLYTLCLKQSRLPVFYGAGKVPDSYDGRIDLLTLHMTTIMAAARKFDAKGTQLNQALYDIMVQDFNIAMREEGLADTGISRRIKPMISMFLERTRDYTGALLGEADMAEALRARLLEDGEAAFVSDLAGYAKDAYADIAALDFDALKAGQFSFPDFKPS